MTNPEASEAARLLGSIRTTKKTESSRASIVEARKKKRTPGRPWKPLGDIPCNCCLHPDKHTKSCPRGQAIKRRQAKGMPTE
jgi:hypothetical protein